MRFKIAEYSIYNNIIDDCKNISKVAPILSPIIKIVH